VSAEKVLWVVRALLAQETAARQEIAKDQSRGDPRGYANSAGHGVNKSWFL
jgi:hypothetical protein